MPLNTVQPDPFTPLNHLHALLYSAAILALLHRHITSLSTSSSTPISSSILLLLLADLLLIFAWVLSQAFRWRPVRRREHTDQLLELARDLPGLDVFICTADPLKEPPITVVSTALSVMAFDYPPEKLSVYVSDDGGSEFTMLALMEAVEFAKYWLPLCRENKIERRSPEAFCESDDAGDCGKLKGGLAAAPDRTLSLEVTQRISQEGQVLRTSHTSRSRPSFSSRSFFSVFRVLVFLSVVGCLPMVVAVWMMLRTSQSRPQLSF